MMRILINDSQNPTAERLESEAFDKAINSFIGDHAKGMRKNIRINTLQVTSNREVKRL